MRALKIVPIILLLLSVVASASRKPQPRFKGAGSGIKLLMSREVKKAIEQIAPDFTTRRMDDYLPRVREQFRNKDLHQAPFAVISDFNLDGLDDLAVDGYTDHD